VSDQETDNEQGLGADQLTDELARKYDPERMLGMVSRRAGKGERLDHSIRAKYEKRFGVDLGHVRVYTGEFAEEFNRQRNAYAVTIGSTGMILMGGSPDKSMGSASGQALLAHELTHVAQAQQGLHRKASFSGGMPFAEEHEAEAEAVEHSVAESGGDHGAETKAATEAGAAKTAGKEALEGALEAIKVRVTEMAADAARNQILRNGIQRRA
jgi:Domain of unknown function (DUF4157)